MTPLGMKTNQHGIIHEARNSFYVRYFETRDGKLVRVSKKLCDADKKLTAQPAPP